MDSGRGVFIVIEGTDGSGKGTQFKLLADRLAREGYDVATFDFPQYEQPSSYFVREYLNGKYGGVDQVGPYTASLFYALDRFEASGHIRTALQQGKVVLANRFVGSSMAHQGTKFNHAEERRGYFIWLDNLEFEMLRIPRPNFSFVLRVPPDVAQSLVDQKGERTYTDKQRDIHEADLGHLTKAAEVYDDMCQLFPKDFIRVDCTRDQKLLGVETIHDILWQKVEPMLPAKKERTDRPAQAQAAALELPTASEPVSVPEPPADVIAKAKEGPAPADMPVPQPPKADLSKEITDQLEDAITSLEGNVYTLSPSLAAAQAAAIVAQLSQRSDDLRAQVLQDAQALTANVSPHLVASYSVVEGISLLASKKLEWSRAAHYVERPPRLAAYDQKDNAGRYRYVTPRQFNETVKEQYCAYMDQIFNLYTEMVRLLAHHLRENSTTAKPAQTEPWEAMILQEAREQLRGVLPVAARTDVAVYGTDFAQESVITTLLSDNLPECRQTGADLLRELHKAKPDFLAGNGIASTVNYHTNVRHRVREIAKEHLPANYADPVKAVRLVSVWPRNEFDLLPDMLYSSSDLPLSSLKEITTEWPYDRKLELFEAYTGERQNITQRPGRAFEKAHYTWDLLCDFDTFRDLQRHRYVDNLDWQELTPRYGYEIPKIVEEADLLDQYEACFELSLRLYSLLQEAGYADEAQYATLLGHKLRWQVTYNAREAFHLHELRSGPHNQPEVRQLVQAMHEKLCEVHPLTGEAMRFAAKSDL